MRGPGFRGCEVAAAFMLLLALTAIAYGPHVAHGGLYSDDWSLTAEYQLGDSPRYLNAIAIEAPKSGGRLLEAPLILAPAALLGSDAAGQIALGLLIAAVMATLVFAVLRRLWFERPHALAIAGLSVIFAPSDATKLWPTAAVHSVAVILFLVGFLVTLEAFSRQRAKARLFHLSGLGLYVASVLVYEVAGIAMLICGGLYLSLVERRVALRRWAADIGVVGLTLSLSGAASAHVREVVGLQDRLADWRHLAKESARLLGSTLTPFGIPDVIVALPLVLASIALFLRAPPRETPAALELRRWAVRSLVFAVLLAAALVPFAAYIGPESLGTENRSKLFAGPVFVALGYSFLATCIVAVAAAAAPNTWRRWSAWGIGAMAALLATGSWVAVLADERDWRKAADRQQVVLNGIREEIGVPPHGTVIYAGGYRGEAAPDVPVFKESWDLRGAVRLMYDDPSLAAYPVLAGRHLRCEQHRLYPEGTEESGFGPDAAARFGDAVFIDVSTGTTTWVGDREECRAVSRHLEGRSGGR